MKGGSGAGGAAAAAAALLTIMLAAASLQADAAVAPRRLLGADHGVAGQPPAPAAMAQQAPPLASVSKASGGSSCGTFDPNISCPPPPHVP
ncbi:hypothetical protein ACP70R_006797 [Stipagrostis hirtigluma subsp. patula]